MSHPLHRALAFTWADGGTPVAALSGLFGGSKPPPLPPPPQVLPMPDLNDPAILAAQQQAANPGLGSGRLSTILTGGSANNYSGQKLGSP